MPSYSEDALAHALDAVKSGVPLARAAREWGIPRTTLRHRDTGKQAKSIAHAFQQKLSPVQENRLADWIRVQDALGVAPTHAQIRTFASRILLAGGSATGVGKHWLQGFLRRNPRIATLRTRRIDSARVNGATTEAIQAWFPHLALPAIQKVMQADRWNMDETGLMQGMGGNGLVLGMAEKKRTFKKDDGRREWTTIIECISADGRYLHPLVIFKGGDVQQQWFPDEGIEAFKDWKFESSAKGWTDDDIAVRWLMTVFIPQTWVPRNRPRLLVVDGHGSHTTDDFMYGCFNANIYLLFLPPHASHVLQPLDLSVFGPIKSLYRSALGNLIYQSDDSPMGKRGFLECYSTARQGGLSEKNVLAGWRATGLWPINCAKPLMSKLVMSAAKAQPIKPQPPNQAQIEPDQAQPNTEIPSTQRRKVVVATPKRSAEIGHLLRKLAPKAWKNPAARLVFQKLGKSIDNKNVDLAMQEAQLQALRVYVNEAKVKKRRKVERADPNKKFATIADVRRTRMGMEPTITVASA
jgi:4-hydroxybenzoate polyprenyltransferase